MAGITVDIRNTSSFLWAFKIFGVILILGLLNPAYSMFVSIPVAVIGVALVTARLGLLLDLKSKTYQEYVWLLGLRLGKKEPFLRIEYLFVKENQVSQKMSSRLATATVHSEAFDGFIRFSESDKLRVYREKDKAALMKKLLDLSAKLNVDILDYTKA